MSMLDRQGTGLLSRFGIGVQVALSAVLALAAVLLVNWLAGRPGVRQRFDLTASGKNSLSTATLGTLERLPEGVKIEILYEPEDPPLTQIADELMSRTEALLALLEDEANGRLEVEVADISNRDAWRERALDLRIEGFESGLLVSRGDLRTFVPLLRRLAQVNIGDPARGIRPSVSAFTAEEAIVEALLDVTRGERLHAYFTFGYGELDAKDELAEFEAGRLGSTLEREGFVVHRWNFVEDGPLPDDCDVLAILGPTQAWPAEKRMAVEAYLASGGRAIVAATPSADELRRSDVPALVEAHGLQVTEGTLMRFIIDPASGKSTDGDNRCAALSIPAAGLGLHPMLDPFRLAGRGFATLSSHQVRVSRQPESGIAQVIAWAPSHVASPIWLDAPPLDFRFDERAETLLGAQAGQAGVMATVQMPPSGPTATPLALEAELETRLVVLGSILPLTNALEPQNADIWRAMFNWVTDRDHRVTVSPRDPDLRFLPRDDPEALVGVVRLAQYWLPLGALCIGVCVAFLRSRGGPSKRTRAEVAA
jgi:hypothetical protein